MAKPKPEARHSAAPVATSLVERLTNPLKCSGCAHATRVYATARLCGGRTRRYCKCEYCGRTEKVESVDTIVHASTAPIQTR
jgi:poly-beta-hydroxyalkanoate depolymerase